MRTHLLEKSDLFWMKLIHLRSLRCPQFHLIEEYPDQKGAFWARSGLVTQQVIFLQVFLSGCALA